MHSHRSVVFLAQPCHFFEFIDTGIDSRFIHKVQRQSAGTFFQSCFHDAEHSLALIISQRPVLIPSHTCPRRAMAGKDRYITWSVAIYRRKEFPYRRVYTGCFMETKKATTHLVNIWCLMFKTDRRQSAIAGYKRSYTLTDKRFKILLRFLLDCKPIIM